MTFTISLKCKQFTSYFLYKSLCSKCIWLLFFSRNSLRYVFMCVFMYRDSSEANRHLACVLTEVSLLLVISNVIALWPTGMWVISPLKPYGILLAGGPARGNPTPAGALCLGYIDYPLTPPQIRALCLSF